MGLDSEYLESERMRLREYLADLWAGYGFGDEFNVADAFINALWREGFAIVPRSVVDDYYWLKIVDGSRED